MAGSELQISGTWNQQGDKTLGVTVRNCLGQAN